MDMAGALTKAGMSLGTKGGVPKTCGGVKSPVAAGVMLPLVSWPLT
jgi:hypothetical protein